MPFLAEFYGKTEFSLVVVKKFFMRSNLMFFPTKFTLQDLYRIIYYGA
jgi:hypothetical protein